MDRRTRTFVVVGVAVISASVASASVYRAVTRIPVREVEVAQTYAIVSARALPLGARVAAADVKRVGWPSTTPLTGGFTRVEDVAGRGLITAVGPNEPITEAKLAPREAGAGLSPAITSGMRAISVKVNEVIGVAGFAVPGAHVDVVATVRRTGDAISRVLVANVPVLSAGTRYDQEQREQDKPIPSTVVTLMVTPAQAEKIALASAEGNITLMLRNPLDQTEPDTPGAQLAGLVGVNATQAASVQTTAAPRAVRAEPVARTSTAAPPSARVEHVPAVPPAYTYEAIRAGKRTQETVR
jgi:pilus assembly protein CpaB